MSENSESVEVTRDPGEIFGMRVERTLRSYYDKQSEIIRLSHYIAEREREIDDRLERAVQIVSSKIKGTCDRIAISKLLEIVSKEFSDSSNLDLSEDEQNQQLGEFVKQLQKTADSIPQEYFPTYFETVLEVLKAPQGAPILRSSLLVSLVGDFEVMVSELIRACYEYQPGRLNESEKTFTISQLEKFADFSEVREYLISQIVDDVLRGSLDDWIAFFVRKFGVEEIADVGQFAVQELMQRRHCIVHNAGLVSGRYLDNLKKFRVDAELDDNLCVSREYLQRSADALFLIAYSLCWDLGFNLVKDSDLRTRNVNVLVDYTMRLLVDDRLDVARRIGDSIHELKSDDFVKLTVKVNRWLAYKFSGSFDLVRHEVVALDLRGKSRLYNLAKCTLLDEDEEAIEVANSLLNDGTITLHNMFTWPLLRNIRGRVETKIAGFE